MGFGTLEIQLLGPMMLPNLNYGIENRPEQTSEYSLGDQKCSLGDQDGANRAPRGKNLDYSSDLLSPPPPPPPPRPPPPPPAPLPGRRGSCSAPPPKSPSGNPQTLPGSPQGAQVCG